MSTVEVSAGGRPVAEVLAWSRDTVDPALRAAVGTLPDGVRHVCGYHFGWWDEHGEPVEVDGGKAIRPALALLGAGAAGGERESALPAAVALELVHNFSLLHDDAMDGDLTRRHRPTAWSVFGLGAAVLAGDALLLLAFDVLATSGHPAAHEGARMLSAAVLDLLDGQSADVSFETRADVEVAECVRMAGGKTGALLGCAGALGALFGGANSRQVDHVRSFGERLGLAFQHVDDLLGIWGDPAVTGKPVYSDLQNRKKSLPVVAALTSGTPAGDELATLYRRTDPLTDAELVRAAELVDLAGGRAWSRAEADTLLNQALDELRAIGPEPRSAAELAALALLATRRDH